MNTLRLDYSKVINFISNDKIETHVKNARKELQNIKNGKCQGRDFLGWLNLPEKMLETELEDIISCAKYLRSRTKVVVVIGIGGSYLGSRAVIESLSDSFVNYNDSEMKIIYAGHNIGEDYYHEILNYLLDKEFGICLISKSGTTTEPAIAFRLLKSLLEEKVGKKEAANRIVAITDESKGALRALADNESYKTFVIPDNVGGRFSVLTPVGLLPIAIAGLDIKELIYGANLIRKECLLNDDNIAVNYAAVRNALYNDKIRVELLANFNPKLHFIGEWWKQLFGESEGKDGKGLFPSCVDFTTDLHSMGQYVQQGVRMIMETVISVEKSKYNVVIPSDAKNLDKLNYLAGRRVGEVNKMAELGTKIAHEDGGVPNIKIIMPEINENYIGQLIYFFELACAVSGQLLGVNAFDQPGVENYKTNMFALLEKPGYEEITKQIKNKID